MRTFLIEALPWLLPISLAFVFRFILLTAALWIMLKIQDLPYHVAGVIGSAALASAFDMIPFVGHFAAVGALTFCVLMLTRSHFVDVRFTVAISYAVLFLMQMLVFSALPDQVTAYARTKAVNAFQQPGDDADPNAPPASTSPAPATEHQPPILGSNDVARVTGASETPAAPAAPVAVVAPAKTNVELARDFSLKGVFNNSRDSQVIFNTGSKTYTIAYGESLDVETPHGHATVRLEKVTDSSAVLNVGGQLVPLSLR
jgi:hypothetical protein